MMRGYSSNDPIQARRRRAFRPVQHTKQSVRRETKRQKTKWFCSAGGHSLIRTSIAGKGGNFDAATARWVFYFKESQPSWSVRQKFTEWCKNDPMQCFVYILGSPGKDRYRTYVGWTNDLDRRLARHNAGTGARSTRGRGWILLYAERYATRREAMSREWYLKRDRRFRKRVAERA